MIAPKIQQTQSVLMVNSQTNWYDLTREEGRFVNLNLAFLRMATVAKKLGVDFDIVDLNNEGVTLETVRAAQETLRPSLAVISLDIKGVGNAHEISKLIKEGSPETQVMWTSAGLGFLVPFVTLFKEEALSDPNVDFILHGDESALEPFLAELASGAEPQTPGIGYKKDGKAVIIPMTGSHQYVEEDYSAVDMEPYIWRWGREILSAPYVKRQRILPISTGVGCVFSCHFCINSNSEWRKRYKLKPKEFLLAQMEQLLDQYKPDVVWLQDDNFFLQKDRAQAVLELLNRRGVQWCGQAVATYVRDDYINEAFFRDTIAPGCTWFGVGFETFSDGLRASLKKKTTLPQVEKLATWCDRYDVPFNPALIFGTTEQTEAQFKYDVLALLKFHQRFPRASCTYQQWRPYPGTEEYRKLESLGVSIPFPETLSEWLEFGDFTDEQIREMLPMKYKALVPYANFLVSRYCSYGTLPTGLLERLVYKALVFGFAMGRPEVHTGYERLRAKARNLRARLIGIKHRFIRPGAPRAEQA